MEKVKKPVATSSQENRLTLFSKAVEVAEGVGEAEAVAVGVAVGEAVGVDDPPFDVIVKDDVLFSAQGKSTPA